MPPKQDRDHLYQALAPLPRRTLADCHGRMTWPQRGVYFFFEAGEVRSGSDQPRIVRVGTHAVSAGSRTKLWNRLSQHKGTRKGTGNHRGSIFRLLVGAALQQCGDIEPIATWGDKSSAPRDVRQHEQDIERAVSDHIGQMPFTWIEVDDEAGRESRRARIERNAIALLTAADRDDPASPTWLGHHCPRPAVQSSGLWNIRHVGDSYHAGFLDDLDTAVAATLKRHA